MNPLSVLIGFWAVLHLPLVGMTQASQSNAKEIISQGEEQLRGASSQSSIHMVIKRPSYERQLYLRFWSQGNERALVEILKPAKEEGVSSLRVGTQMWNYLPKTDQVVRVPSSLMLQSWMGSDFTNDDLMKASSLSRDYTHKILGKEQKNQENTVVIECLPLPSAPVVWGKVKHWARESDNLPVFQEFFDEHGKLVRTIQFSQFKKMDDRVIPTELKIVKAGNKNESTTISYEKIVFDKQIPDSLFSKDEIRKISQKGKVLTAGWFSEPKRSN